MRPVSTPLEWWRTSKRQGSGQREETIYVDYVAYVDGYRNEHYWHDPDPRRPRILVWELRPKVLDVALALHGVGMTNPAALAVVAQLCRAAPLDDAVRWPAIQALNVRTLETLDEAGLLRARSEAVQRLVANDWLFLLFPLDLREAKVDAEDLREAQRNGIRPRPISVWEAADGTIWTPSLGLIAQVTPSWWAGPVQRTNPNR